MTGEELARKWYAGYPENEGEEHELWIQGLGSQIDKHFVPRQPNKAIQAELLTCGTCGGGNLFGIYCAHCGKNIPQSS